MLKSIEKLIEHLKKLMLFIYFLIFFYYSKTNTRLFPVVRQRRIVSRLIEQGFDLEGLIQTAGKICLDKRVLRVND